MIQVLYCIIFVEFLFPTFDQQNITHSFNKMEICTPGKEISAIIFDVFFVIYLQIIQTCNNSQRLTKYVKTMWSDWICNRTICWNKWHELESVNLNVFLLDIKISQLLVRRCLLASPLFAFSEFWKKPEFSLHFQSLLSPTLT